MFRAGILSDTHLSTITPEFVSLADEAFNNCNVIFHAGDITDIALLDIFKGKSVHAVHGNMCSYTTQKSLPYSKVISLAGYNIGLCHGAGPRQNIEDRLWSQFAEVDCIIYGHTHNPVCERRGSILYINPGSFQCTSSYGSPASYATLTLDSAGLKGKLHTITLMP